MNGWLGVHYGCKGNWGYEPRPVDCWTDPTWTAGRYAWYPSTASGRHTVRPDARMSGERYCCEGCAKGVGGCSGCSVGALRGRKVERVEVGRSRPNDEIAAFEAQVHKLKQDLRDFEASNATVRQEANWAALSLQVGAFMLRVGQWVTAQRSDYWWGDDDEAAFAQLKDEYNRFRDQILNYTPVKVTAPEANVPPPTEDVQEKIADTVTGLVWFGAIAAAVVYLGPPLLARTLPMLRRG